MCHHHHHHHHPESIIMLALATLALCYHHLQIVPEKVYNNFFSALDSFWYFGHLLTQIWTLLDSLAAFGHFWTVWTILDSLDAFGQFGRFWTVWTLLDTFGQFWTLLDAFE